LNNKTLQFCSVVLSQYNHQRAIEPKALTQGQTVICELELCVSDVLPCQQYNCQLGIFMPPQSGEHVALHLSIRMSVRLSVCPEIL
jgi:hypothetical protein